jgi:hypothetical protein
MDRRACSVPSGRQDPRLHVRSLPRLQSGEFLAPKDAFDSRASMVGLDGASVELRPLLVAGASDTARLSAFP